MGKGKFITFEGIDGSGKTSAAKRIVRELKGRGFDAVYTCEPTGSWLGDAVKSSYGRKVSPFTEHLLFLADRATHTDEIKEMVGKGKVVVCDRYADSTYAYQAVILKEELKGLDIEPVEWLKAFSRPFVVDPDLTLLIIVAPSMALKRLRGKGSKFEKRGFLEDVHEVYLRLAEENARIRKVDASLPLKEVVERSLDIVMSVL